MCKCVTGEGRVSPLDTNEFILIRIKVEDGITVAAEYECTDDEYVRDCCEALCSVMTGLPFADIMQADGRAVIYNTRRELPREKLYLASMAVLAAKRAAQDCAKKNGTELAGGPCSCG